MISATKSAQLAEFHGRWVDENLENVSRFFDPSAYPKPGSDYNLHHVDLDADGEAEDHFWEEAMRIMGRETRSGLKHLRGRHNQADHGRGRRGGAIAATFRRLTPADASAMQAQMLKGAPWSGADEEALSEYSGGDYDWINGGLRDPARRASWGQDVRGEMLGRIQTIHDAMRPLPDDVTVTRHTNLASYGIAGGAFTSPSNRQAGLEKLRKLEGEVFQEPGFLSTSIDENNSFPGGVVLHLKVPKGTPAAYLESVSGLPNEHEMLLAAGLKMKIESVDISGERAVVHASALPYKPPRVKASPSAGHPPVADHRAPGKMSALSDPDNMMLLGVAEHGDLFGDPGYCRMLLGGDEPAKSSTRRLRMRRKHLPGQHNQQDHGHHGPHIPGSMDGHDVLHDEQYWGRFGDEMYSENTESGLAPRIFENGASHLALDLDDSHFQVVANLEDAEGMRNLAGTIRDVLDLDLDSYGDDDVDEDGFIYRAKDLATDVEFGRDLSGDVSILTDDGGRVDITDGEAEDLADRLESVAEVWDREFEYTEHKSGLRRRDSAGAKEGHTMATKSFNPTIKAVGQTGDQGTATFRIASYNEVDKDGDVTLPGFFGEQHAQLVPVHDWNHVPIGKGRIYEMPDGAYCDAKFNLKIPEARNWYEAIKFDMENPPALQNYSYGYEVLAGGSKSGQHSGRQVRYLTPMADGTPGVKVFEVSPVLQGAGTGTRTVSVKGRSMRTNRSGAETTTSRAVKGAIPAHETKTVSRAWDRTRTENALPEDARPSELRTVYAYVDPDGDPELKSSYGFPHHHGIGGPANLRACLMGIAALNGQSGADMGEAERKGIYDHLAAHLKDGDREVPDLRTGPGDNSKSRFADEAATVLASVSGLIDRASDVVALRRTKGKGMAASTADLMGWVGDELVRLKSLLANPVEPETPQPDDDEIASVVAASIARLNGI